MKKIAMMAILVAASVGAGAQEKGTYWVVENSADRTENSIVRIYDEDHNLLTERRADKRLNPESRKDRRMLNRLVSKSEVSGTAVAVHTDVSKRSTKRFDPKPRVSVE